MSHDSDRLIAEYAYVLFMDIVGYTLLPTLDDKKRVVATLQNIVRNTKEFKEAQERGNLISRDAGDGLALVFFHDATAPLYCAVEIARALKDKPELRLRMGINSGLVSRTTDINGHDKVSGEGIDMAQRVMDCGQAGHILLSQACADLMRQVSQWAGALHNLGEYPIKHDRTLCLYNLYMDQVGNPVPPPITPKDPVPTPSATPQSAPPQSPPPQSQPAPLSHQNKPAPSEPPAVTKTALPRSSEPTTPQQQSTPASQPATTTRRNFLLGMGATGAAVCGLYALNSYQHRTKTNPTDGAAMAWIPAGTFRMGSDEDDEAKPVHHVSMSGFWMYKTPVTVAQFQKYDEESGKDFDWTKNKPSWGWVDNHPMVNVSWDQASDYAKWAGVALPTEAQWEYAARGGLEGKNYPWGDAWNGSKCANSVSSNDLKGPKPVASYSANGYGLYDMAGNVYQWCADWYDSGYYKTLTNSISNPTGPRSGRIHVFRGGSWDYGFVSAFRCAYRSGLDIPRLSGFIGFRCCSSVG